MNIAAPCPHCGVQFISCPCAGERATPAQRDAIQASLEASWLRSLARCRETYAPDAPTSHDATLAEADTMPASPLKVAS